MEEIEEIEVVEVGGKKVLTYPDAPHFLITVRQFYGDYIASASIYTGHDVLEAAKHRSADYYESTDCALFDVKRRDDVPERDKFLADVLLGEFYRLSTFPKWQKLDIEKSWAPNPLEWWYLVTSGTGYGDVYILVREWEHDFYHEIAPLALFLVTPTEIIITARDKSIETSARNLFDEAILKLGADELETAIKLALEGVALVYIPP